MGLREDSLKIEEDEYDFDFDDMLSDEGIIEPLEPARGLKFDHDNKQFWKELLNTEYQTMKR